MTDRDDVREAGSVLRSQLGLADSVAPTLLPGLADLVDELVFGSVWSRAGLARPDRMLATLSALSSKQYLSQLRRFVGAALDMGLDARLVQEVMLHCGMYAGIPSAENSLAVVADVLDQRGMAQPAADLDSNDDATDLEQLYSRGLETMTTLHAERSRDGYAAPTSTASDLYDIAIRYLYGEIWNRPGITTRQRMICSVASFTALQMEGQQRKFFRSALNVGLSAAEVCEVIVQTGPYSGFPPALNALVVAESVINTAD
ncbi:MAG: carboxymuconolactone decarboxylase family protein [Acidimicrobiales bacterium]